MTERAKFYTDAHIDYQVAKQLRAKDIVVIRCQDVGMDNAKDHEHLTYAAEQGLVVITCDQDFTDLHFQWLGEGKTHAGIVYCLSPELCTIKVILENVIGIWEDPDSKAQMMNLLWRVQK